MKSFSKKGLMVALGTSFFALSGFTALHAHNTAHLGVCVAPLGDNDADSCYQWKNEKWCDNNGGTWYAGVEHCADLKNLDPPVLMPDGKTEIPLLITISDFTATRNSDGDVEIELITGSETNTAKLYVYRAPAKWQNPLQIVPVCWWNSAGPSTYSCVDQSAPASVVYVPVEVEFNGGTNSYLNFLVSVP